MRISLQPAFILHRRPYRETSFIIDFFTQDYGRISAVAKGVRQLRSNSKAVLQSFVPLSISWQGKNDLVTLTSAEAQGVPLHLKKDCLLAGFYLNELLMRMLHKHDPFPELYAFYADTLAFLQSENLEQKYLRIFEKKLLEEIGYGLPLITTIPEKVPFETHKHYQFQVNNGFIATEQSETTFVGKSIIDLERESLEDEKSLRDAKRIMRIVFSVLLGDKPLNSRKLFA